MNGCHLDCLWLWLLALAKSISRPPWFHLQQGRGIPLGSSALNTKPWATVKENVRAGCNGRFVREEPTICSATLVSTETNARIGDVAATEVRTGAASADMGHSVYLRKRFKGGCATPPSPTPRTSVLDRPTTPTGSDGASSRTPSNIAKKRADRRCFNRCKSDRFVMASSIPCQCVCLFQHRTHHHRALKTG